MALSPNDEPERHVSPSAAGDAEAEAGLQSSTLQTLNAANREATELGLYHSASTVVSACNKTRYQGYTGSLKKFWQRQVSLTVPHVKCRDHLANERTFLAWIRTSIALSMLGAVIAQLFRLQNGPSPTGAVNLFVMATPLACLSQVAALMTALVGGHRYWRQQIAMARGQALGSGWELWLLIGGSGSILLILFAAILALD